MSLLIEARQSKLEGLIINRLLPYAKRRSIGPFIFLDYLGPITLNEGKNFDILAHPHIGISTLSYIFVGRMHHRDSLGTYQEIGPGDVNLMTAGSGIVHSERLPKNRPLRLHSLQFWLALPKDQQEIEPSFYNCSAEQLPKFHINNVELTLIIGKAWQKASPVPEHWPCFLLEAKSANDQELPLNGHLSGELGIFVISGSAQITNTKINPGQILYLEAEKYHNLKFAANSHVMLMGGEPLTEPRKMYWNFVHTDQSKIEEAKRKWRNQEFAKIPGETEFVPLPDP